jgi:hypothetical protein
VSFTVSAPADTTAPTIGAIRPAAGASGSWTAMACNQPGTSGRICVTASDNVAVTGVTIVLTKVGNGRCWNGTSSTGFDATSCGTPVALTLSGGVWVSTPLAWQNSNGQPNFNTGSYTLDIAVRDAAGNTATASRSFSISGA